LKTHWRLILSPASSAALNMALDEVCLQNAAQKVTPPTLRLYSWQTPTLSLGYSQKSADVDLEELTKRNWQMVRRQTGGKAILHTDELTYSITASADDPLVAGSLLESYQRLSSILQKALGNLGVDTSADKEYPENSTFLKTDAVCFGVPSNYEITHQGKKLIGSAQARKFGGILQHGSLPLIGDLTRITQVLVYPSKKDRELAAQQLLEHAATLESCSGKVFSWEEAACAVITAFSAFVDGDLVPSNPTGDEQAAAAELARSKYAEPTWNFRR
jgi:lipoyl(octanoyl) transferase